MHPEIEALLHNLATDDNIPNDITLRNAEILLNYIEDINLERSGKFELTPADSLYLLWNIGKWEIHIECLQNGKILYTFRKSGYAKGCGTISINAFLALLERYLLTGIC